MYELQAANSVRNHPAAPNATSAGHQVKAPAKRTAALDPSMTQPGGVLGRQHTQTNQTFSQLETSWQTGVGGPKRSASKAKLGLTKVQRVKKNSMSSNQQVLLTGLAQKVSAVACANLKSEQH